MALSETITETAICNMGLGKLGSKRIDNVETDTSLEAILCRLHYEQTRDALLRSISWRFARDRIKLVSAWATTTVYTTDQYASNDDVWYKCLKAHTSGDLDDEPGVGAVAGTYWTTLTEVDYVPGIGEWDFMWALPSDFLRFRSIYEESGYTSKTRRHAIEGQNLLTNLSGVGLRYIKNVTDPTEFDPLFIEVFTWLLADKMIGPLAGGDARGSIQKKIDITLDKLIPKAKAVNIDETDVGGRSDWNLARHGGLGIAGQEERFW